MNLLDVSPAYGGNLYLMIGALVTFLALFVLYARRVSSKSKQGHGGQFALRDIQAYNAARDGLSRAAETGRAVHTSPGTGSIGGGQTTASTLAGLTLVEAMARVSAITGAPVQSTANDAVAYNLAESAVRSGLAAAATTLR